MKRPIVFLHIPKTAGQTVHHALAAMVGRQNVSPIRVNGQAEGTTLPPGYVLHSGHIDWTDLERLPGDPFVFTVLRDPAERIGSFYFYMLKTAQAASPEEVRTRPGLERILTCSADDYFFGGDGRWQLFVRSHYDNFYCSYLATRRVGGRRQLQGLRGTEIVARALAGAGALDRIYRIEALAALEDDIERLYGRRIAVAGRHQNAGGHRPGERRWPKLLARFERDDSARRLQDFLSEDEALLAQLAAAGRLQQMAEAAPPARSAR